MTDPKTRNTPAKKTAGNFHKARTPYLFKRGRVFWFRKAIRKELTSAHTETSIRRSLKTPVLAVAQRRAWILSSIIEETFDELIATQRVDDAFPIVARIVDQVMDDFDPSGRRFATRAKWGAVRDRLNQVALGEVAHFEQRVIVNGGSRRWTRYDPPYLIAGQPLSAPIYDFLEFKTAIKEAIDDVKIRPGGNRLLSSFIDEYFDEKKARIGESKHISESKARISDFVTFVGDKPVHEYSRKDFLDYRDAIDQIQARSRQKHPGLNIRAVLERVHTDGTVTQLMNPKTINAKWLSPPVCLFEWLQEEKLVVEKNFARGIQSTRTVDLHEIREDEERLPLSNDQVKQLIKLTSSKAKSTPDRWAFAVLSRTGMRLDEFAQLRASDFKVFDGQPVIDLLHTDIDGKGSRQRRNELNIKSRAGRRVIPIHQDLIKSGLLYFVDQRRQSNGDDAWLFPSCKPDKHGCRSAAMSKRLNRVIDKIVRDARYTVHSLRHSFAERCDAAGISQTLKDKWLGHAPSNGTSKMSARYGSPVPSLNEMRKIDRLDFHV